MWGGRKIRRAMLRHIIAGCCCWQPRFFGAPNVKSAAGAFPCCWRMPRQHGGHARAARMHARRRHHAEAVALLKYQLSAGVSLLELGCVDSRPVSNKQLHTQTLRQATGCQQVDGVAAVRWPAKVH
jgi:hypothetical protein